MVQLIKRIFRKKKYIKFEYLGKYGLRIDTTFSNDEIKDFLFSVYSNDIINDIMDYLKVHKEDQYDYLVNFLEEQAKLVLQSQNIDDPIIGVLGENNNMGRS
jgi:hypothetical protein